MNRLSKKTIPLITAAAAIALASCTVDKDYSFEGSSEDVFDSIDTSISLFENGIDVPIGNSTKKTLGSLIGNETSSLKTDSDGNYLITSKSLEDFSQDFVLPAIQVYSFNVPTSNIVNYDFPPAIVGKSLPTFETTIDFNDQLDIDINQEIGTKKVVDIKRIELSAPVSVVFDLNVGSYTIKNGFKVVLPDQFEISAVSSDIKIVDKNIIEFTKDVVVPSSGIEIKTTLNAFNLKSGNLVEEAGSLYLRFNSFISVIGQVDVKGSDFAIIPSNFTATYTIKTSVSNIEKIEGKVEASEEIEINPVKIEAPSVLKESKLILSDPVIKFTVTNNSEFNLILSATIQTLKNHEIIEQIPISVTVPADKVSDIYLCKENHQVPEGAIAVKDDRIVNLARKFPDEVRFLSPVARIHNTDYQLFTLDRTRHAALGYDISFPLALKNGSEMDFEYEIKGLNLDFGSIDAASFGLAFDAVSTIPAEFEFSATAFDKDGVELQNVKAEVLNDKGGHSIKGGSPEKAASTPLSIALKMDPGSEISNLDGFKLKMKATVPDYCEDICFNANQYIQLTNIKAHASNIEINK